MKRVQGEADGSVVDAARHYYSDLEGMMAAHPPPLAMVGMGSLQEDQVSIKSDDYSVPRVKFMCSTGGRILPRPLDGHLRYVGGETRIVVVNRNIMFADLIAKLGKLFGRSLSLKYQLPNEDLDALVSVLSDEDLENMMEEYDRLEARPGPARLRLFLFPSKQAASAPPLVDHVIESKNQEQRYMDAVNGVTAATVHLTAPQLPAAVPVADYLFGLDTVEHWNHERIPVVSQPVVVASISSQVVHCTGELIKSDGVEFTSNAPPSPMGFSPVVDQPESIERNYGYVHLTEMFPGKFSNMSRQYSEILSDAGSPQESGGSAASSITTLSGSEGGKALIDSSQTGAAAESASMGHAAAHRQQRMPGEDDTLQTEAGSSSSNPDLADQEPTAHAIASTGLGSEYSEPRHLSNIAHDGPTCPDTENSNLEGQPQLQIKPHMLTGPALKVKQTNPVQGGGRLVEDESRTEVQPIGDRCPEIVGRHSDLAPLQTAVDSSGKEQGSGHFGFDGHHQPGLEMDGDELPRKYWKAAPEPVQQDHVLKQEAQHPDSPTRVEKNFDYNYLTVQHISSETSDAFSIDSQNQRELEPSQAEFGAMPYGIDQPVLQHHAEVFSSQERLASPFQTPYFQTQSPMNLDSLSYWTPERIPDPSSSTSHLYRPSQFPNRNMPQTVLLAPGSSTQTFQRAATVPSRGTTRNEMLPRHAIPTGAHSGTAYHRQSSFSNFGDPRTPLPATRTLLSSAPAVPTRFRDNLWTQSEERILRGPPVQQQPVVGSRPNLQHDAAQVPFHVAFDQGSPPDMSYKLSAPLYKGVNPFQEADSPFPESSSLFPVPDSQSIMALAEGRRHAVAHPGMWS